MGCEARFGLIRWFVVSILISFFPRSGYAGEFSIENKFGAEYWPSTHYTLNRTKVRFDTAGSSLGINYTYEPDKGEPYEGNSLSVEGRFGYREFSADSYTPPADAFGHVNLSKISIIGRHYYLPGSKRAYSGLAVGITDINTHVDNSAANVGLHGLTFLACGGIEAEYFNFLVLSLESRLGLLWVKDSYGNKISTTTASVLAGVGVRW